MDQWFAAVVEESTERVSGGKPSNRYSVLEQVWTFQIPSSQSLTFHLQASGTAGVENDDFVFAYSTDDANYTAILTVASNEQSATPTAFILPAAPTALNANAAKGKILVRWTQSVTPNLTENRLYRSEDGLTYTLLTALPPVTSYTDTQVNSGMTYFYVVTAVNGSGESPYSDPASASAK